MIHYKVKKGAALILALDAVEGDPSDASSISATAKEVAGDATLELTITPREEAGGIAAGFDLIGDTTDLPLGEYEVDAIFYVNDLPYATTTVGVLVEGSPTGGE